MCHDDSFCFCHMEPEKPPKDTTRMAFGLRAQGHTETVRKMRKQAYSWEEIGKAIGWDGATVAEYYYRFEEPRHCKGCNCKKEAPAKKEHCGKPPCYPSGMVCDCQCCKEY